MAMTMRENKKQKNEYNMYEPSGVRRILDWFDCCLSDRDQTTGEGQKKVSPRHTSRVGS